MEVTVEGYDVRNNGTKVEIDFPHKDGKVRTAVFNNPIFSETRSNQYFGVFNDIKETPGVRLPTGEDSAYFLHALYCGPEEFINSREVRKFKGYIGTNDDIATSFILPQINILTPESYGTKHGVYVFFDEHVKGTDKKSVRSIVKTLDQKLQDAHEVAQDVFIGNGVGFAHRSTFEKTDKLSENGFVIANSGGIAGAQKMDEFSKTLKGKLVTPREQVGFFSLKSARDYLYINTDAIDRGYVRRFSFAMKE